MNHSGYSETSHDVSAPLQICVVGVGCGFITERCKVTPAHQVAIGHAAGLVNPSYIPLPVNAAKTERGRSGKVDGGVAAAAQKGSVANRPVAALLG